MNIAKQESRLYWTELNQIYPAKKQKGSTKSAMILIDSMNVKVPPECIQDYVNNYFTTFGQELAEDYVRSFANNRNY